MKRVLVICPTYRDKRELGRYGAGREYFVTFQSYDSKHLERIFYAGSGWMVEAFDPSFVINELSIYCKDRCIDAVISSEDYPGSILVSIIAQSMGFVGPKPEHILLFQHKYYARKVQQQFVPDATPWFMIVNRHAIDTQTYNVQFPVFVKPVKSFFSVGAGCAYDYDNFVQQLGESLLPAEFLAQFAWFSQTYSPYKDHVYDLLVEECLTGMQVTLEGYVYNAQVYIIGIIDSVMFSGTISFKRFDYPSCLPKMVQEQMADIACRLMKGVGFNNSFFNIEFMYDAEKDRITIIEVNPRMVSQFADFYEKVHGINTYDQAIALALGQKPRDDYHQKGDFVRASCFVLRLFEDKRVTRVPTQQELEAVYALFPEARVDVFVQEGQKLSDVFQDGKSYRYGLIHLGGRDQQELQEKYERCKQILSFEFADL